MRTDRQVTEYILAKSCCWRVLQIIFAMLSIFIWILFIWIVRLHPALSINVALHAQILPSANQIVGSVITTDGLKAALERRPDVDSVSVFYPASYRGYLDTEWDLLLIEGWFPSIIEFIQLTRNRFPGIKIVYYCLDPTYPAYDDLVTFDVDGILTNSEVLLNKLPIVNKQLMLLAADEVKMAPNAQVARDFGAVYVGAGGPMLKHKPALYKTLLSAVPHGLRLHGFHWEGVEGLNQVWRGALPRDELASAYASAHTVLASTIASQGDSGMINNRIFEALSCGAVVISDHSPALENLLTNRKDPTTGQPLPDLVLFFNETHPADGHIERVRRNPQYFDEVRRLSREFILQGHTWSHRAVQLINFYDRLKSAEVAGGAASAVVESDRLKDGITRLCPLMNRCGRHRCPRMLWVVSETLSQHADYLHHLSVVQASHVCRQYDVITLSESQWMDHVEEWSTESCDVARVNADSVNAAGMPQDGDVCHAHNFLSQFDVLLIHATPFDPLDISMSYLPGSVQVKGKQRLQKRALMMMGFDTSFLLRMSQEALQLVDVADLRSVFTAHYVNHYDVVMFRSHFELQLLQEVIGCHFSEMRLQHVFGVGLLDSTSEVDAARLKTPHDVVVCFYTQRHLCSAALREQQLLPESQQRTVLLLLLGGDWEDWLAMEGGVIPSGTPLSNVVHVRPGEYSRRAVALVRTAGHVYLMQEENDLLLPAGGSDQFWSQCVSASLSGPPVGCLLNTTSDVLWPFVAAAASEHNVSIHLLRTVSGLFSLMDRDVAGWTEQVAVQSLTSALSRLHGFGSRLSTVKGRVLSIMKGVDGRGVCVDCDPDDAAQVDLSQSDYVDHFLDRDVVDDVTNTGPRIVHKTLLKMTYTEFEVGRDGECCLEQIMTVPSDNVVCLQRPFEFVELLVMSDTAFSSSAQLPATIPVRLYLRGTFYADSFYSTSVDVPLNVDHDLLSRKRGLKASDNSGSLKNKIFTYVLTV